jgi:hypothetical protein
MSDQALLFPQIDALPAFCQYAEGPCDQNFTTAVKSHALFLYPTDPVTISSAIENAVAGLNLTAGDKRWITWRHLAITGQIIFCEVCKALRFTSMAIADVTTLNFNVLFEVGFALGLGVPVLPIRDTSYVRDKRMFDELGILDTFGYLDFQNSQMELAHQVVHYETNLKYRDPKLRVAFERVATLYGEEEDTEQADFSERLLKLVGKIADRRRATVRVAFEHRRNHAAYP